MLYPTFLPSKHMELSYFPGDTTLSKIKEKEECRLRATGKEAVTKIVNGMISGRFRMGDMLLVYEDGKEVRQC